jgi:DNA-binding MarR family transcriptional regulator
LRSGFKNVWWPYKYYWKGKALTKVQKIRPNQRVRDPSSAALGRQLGFVGTRLGYILHITDVLHMDFIRGMLADIGLTPARATALSFIRANADCGQAELGRALKINRASNMELVNSLVALNSVERRGGRDKRSNALYLTQRGEELYAQFIEISIETDSSLTSALTPEEAGELGRLLNIVQQSLENHKNQKGRTL